MTTIDVFRTLMDYNHALFRRVWESIMQLTDEQFVHELPYSHGSLRNQMVHVAAVQMRWLMALQEVAGARGFTLRPADYPTREAARMVWEASAQDLAEYVAGLDDAALARTPAGMRGPVWQVLAHLVNHGTDHRAQMLRALHDAGAPTFDQDLISYLWAR